MGIEGHIDEGELPPVATVTEDGEVEMVPLAEAYPNPSLDRIVMKIEDYGTAPISGKQDLEKLREAYWEFGSWLRQKDIDADE